jgi:hypothetical protein
MVAAAAYQLRSRGVLVGIAGHCGSLAAALGTRRWGLWAAWRACEAVACHLLALGDALLGLSVLLAAPWLLYRSGLLRWGALVRWPAVQRGCCGWGAAMAAAC